MKNEFYGNKETWQEHNCACICISSCLILLGASDPPVVGDNNTNDRVPSIREKLAIFNRLICALLFINAVETPTCCNLYTLVEMWQTFRIRKVCNPWCVGGLRGLYILRQRFIFHQTVFDQCSYQVQCNTENM